MGKSNYFYMAVNLIVFLCVIKVPVFAQSQSSDLFNLSLDELLNATITTASKGKKSVRDTPASVIIITRSDIEVYGYSTVPEILNNIPGMYQIDDYAWHGSLNYGVRGFYSAGHFNDMIILVNGVARKESLYDSYHISKIALPVELIERIEVVRGPLSVTYGSGAFMGAINIITRDFDSDEQSTNLVSMSVGSNETYRTVGSMSGQYDDDFSYNVDVGYSVTDGIDFPWLDMVNDPASLTDFAGIPVDTTSEGQLDEENIYFNGAFKFKQFGFELNYTKTDKGTVSLVPTPDEGTNDDIEAIITTVTYDDVTQGGTRLHAQASYNYYTNDMTMRWSFAGDNTFNLINNKAYELEFTAGIDITDNLDILIGLNRHTQINNISGFEVPPFGFNTRFVLPDDETVNQNGVFVIGDYQFSEKLSFTGGLRVEQLEKFKLRATTASGGATDSVFTNDDLNLLTNFAMIYSFNDKHVLKALFGNALKQPAFGDSAELLLQPDLPQLKPAKIKTYEIDYIGSFTENFGLSVNLFYNVLEDLINRENVESGGQALVFSLNSGSQENIGLEAGFKYEPVESLYIDTSVIFLDSKNKDNGFENIEIGYSPKVLGNIKVSYLFDNEMSLALSGRYVDSMETLWDVAAGADPSTGSRVGSKVDSYFPVDFNFRINNLWSEDIFMAFTVTNIFDEEVRYPTTKITPFFTKGTLGDGRGFLISIGKKFPVF